MRDIESTKANMAVARSKLYNAGLQDAGCVAAYFGALFAGADAATAFEAARRHELLMIPLDPYSTHTQRRYQYPDEYRAACKRLEERRARVTALPNPFLAPDSQELSKAA